MSAFAPGFTAQAKRLAVAVMAHATPVGSSTVARTERIPIERRAEAAVIAWMRHQTTAYDNLTIDLHRRDVPHAVPACPLCTALARLGAPESSSITQ